MKLELTSVDRSKPPIILHQFPVIVGLDPGANICLDDSSVGHYQCMIDDSDGVLMVWDLGTKLGTVINGVRISQKAPLMPGDELGIGRTVSWSSMTMARPSRPGTGSTTDAAAPVPRPDRPPPSAGNARVNQRGRRRIRDRVSLVESLLAKTSSVPFVDRAGFRLSTSPPWAENCTEQHSNSFLQRARRPQLL